VTNIREALYIGGKWSPASGGTFTVVSPTSEDPIATVCMATQSDVDVAVSASPTMTPRNNGGRNFDRRQHCPCKTCWTNGRSRVLFRLAGESPAYPARLNSAALRSMSVKLSVRSPARDLTVERYEGKCGNG
jgi:hypothetical protein